jgi:hypothetical protein
MSVTLRNLDMVVVAVSAPLAGFHGATVITIYDANGHQLDQWYNGPFVVEEGQSYPVTWTETNSRGFGLHLHFRHKFL